jgi:hypothetical protein
LGSKLLNTYIAGMKAIIQDGVGILLDAVPPPVAPTLTAAAGPGLTGTYTYKVTFVFPRGETQGGVTSNPITLANQAANLTIPVFPIGVGMPRCIARRIYRTKANGADGTQQYVTTLVDNQTGMLPVTSIASEALPDASLGAGVPTAALPNDYIDAFNRALSDYSKRKPLAKTLDVASDGTGDFLLTGTNGVLPGYDEYFDPRLTIEYPISLLGQKPAFFDADDYTRYRQPGGFYFRMLRAIAPSGDLVRFGWNANHSVDNTGSTVSDNDYDMLLYLASAEGCDVLAVFYSQTSDNILSDVADYKTKSKEYENRAATLRANALGPPQRPFFV